ncbi:MAG: SRPBCC family protein [Actinomycetaceae bacterium]|nr:SRPBCC family protein [Actinomycetaceae bacterium]
MRNETWSHFTVEMAVPATADVVWSRLWDLGRHSHAVPFTTVISQSESLDWGARFIARTDLGFGAIDDRMVVRRWEPPNRARVEKIGPLLFGTIEATIMEEAAGCRLIWEQTYAVRGLPRFLAYAFGPVAKWSYQAVLERIIERRSMEDAFEHYKIVTGQNRD